jgi:signal transduction histidine kinase
VTGGKTASNLKFLILILAAASLLLPAVAALPVFGLLIGLWAWSSRRSGPVILVVTAAAAVLAVLVAEFLTGNANAGAERMQAKIEESYRETWRNLDEAAARTVDQVREIPIPQESPLAYFRLLDREANAVEGFSPTLLLFDQGGRILAWGGRGLLHDIGERSPLSEGRSHLASFGAVTLVSVHAIDLTGETWHLAAGLSLRTDAFPFARLAAPVPRWSVVAAGGASDQGALRFSAGTGPELIVESVAPAGRLPVGGSAWRRAAWWIWGLGLLWISGLLMAGRRASGEFTSKSIHTGALGISVGSTLIGLGSLAPAWVVALLAVSGYLFSWIQGSTGVLSGMGAGAIVGAVAGLSVPGVALLVDRFTELPDLGSQLWSGPAHLVTRAGLALLVWSLLGLVRRGGGGETASSGRWLALGFVSIILAGALLDSMPVALILTVVAGILFAVWSYQRSATQTLTRAAILGLVAALLAGTGWELVFRLSQKNAVRGPVLAAMAPPTPAEVESLADEMQAFLGSSDIGTLAPVAIEELSRQDLAFEVWHHSPLAGYGGLSALRVLPRDGVLSSFSFGLPLNKESWVDWASPLWGAASVPEWEDAVLVGDGQVRSEGQPWAYAEYALVLQPGFRLRRERQEDLAQVLMRTGPSRRETSLLQLPGVSYVLYDEEGQAIVAPWPQPPELPGTLLAGGETTIETPAGPALAFSARGLDGVRVVFLQLLSVAGALERVGTHALPTILLMVAIVVIVQLPQLIRTGIRETWYQLWHSYSRRLVMVYSVLLLVPLGIINFLVVRAFEDRLVRDQEAAGLRAVQSAQGVLGEYVLALQPGFGIDAALDHEVLFWLSSVVHHDVNLYWRGSVYASSKSELFSAGLLPRRIPGDIYSDLTLMGYEVSMRTNRAGGAEYLELYAPLTVPGVSFDETRLIVSLPLLAQQEETASQIASLRRRSLLGTSAVVLLIAVLGVLLARRFTSPLTDIVAGTQRIAAGDASLNLQPVELELVTLVEAIDDMAQRIHAGRQDLLREKNVVERMVENITAGVVSLDQDSRVLMANRVAGELVGVEVGQELSSVVRDSERLQPLAAVLDDLEGDRLTQKTVTLADESGKEQEWTAVWVPLPGSGEPSALLVLEDVTEVLRGQRLEAWAEMARMIAHEIKNPLTPIRLSAEHMQEVYATDPDGFAQVFESCTSNILQQVDELQEIATDFSTYSRIPKIEPRQGDLVEVLQEVVEAYRSTPQQGVTVRFESQEGAVKASFDTKLLGRAVRNLLENAIRAAPPGGEVVVEVQTTGSVAQVVVADNGPGVRESWLQKIFDPYFSTHDSGTGLGLPIARRIVEEHGGTITARNGARGGLEVLLTLPIEPE